MEGLRQECKVALICCNLCILETILPYLGVLYPNRYQYVTVLAPLV